MKQRRKMRAEKEGNLSVQEDSPRGRSRERSRLLTSTPDKRELENWKRSSSARVVRTRSQQLQDDDEMENADQSILSKSLLNNNNTLKFDDKPEHLYGLDNPADISSDKEGDEQKSRPEQNAETGMITPFYKSPTFFLAFLCVCLLTVLTGIGTHQKQQYEEVSAEVKLLKNQIRKMLQQSNQGIKLNQDHIYQKVLLRDQSSQCDVQQVEEFFKQAIRLWDADKIAVADYALESTGGQIHSSYHSATFANGAAQVLLFGIPLWYDVKTPRVIIQPGNSPGDCWAFQGSAGFVVIKLSQMIKPSAFTLEHMDASLSQFGDRSIPSAPKEFSVWGWSDAHGNEKLLLGDYVYDHKGYALQSFAVQATSVPDFRFIELRVISNYGNPSYTCLYRFRVHGLPHRINN